jgi:hypothetical protein
MNPTKMAARRPKNARLLPKTIVRTRTGAADRTCRVMKSAVGPNVASISARPKKNRLGVGSNGERGPSRCERSTITLEALAAATSHKVVMPTPANRRPTGTDSSANNAARRKMLRAISANGGIVRKEEPVSSLTLEATLQRDHIRTLAERAYSIAPLAASALVR